MAKVTLTNLSKAIGATLPRFRSVNIEIADRELVVLFGRTGAGKSSIVRMIAGLEEVSSGDIAIGDRRVNDVAPDGRDVALVTANQTLYPAMTVRDNLAVALQLRKFKESEIARRIEDAVKILEISELLDRKPADLSAGQSQRVAVARALVRQPKVILFDEPLAGLDADTRSQMRTEIAKLHQRRNATIIYATSDSTEAMTLADRIAVFEKGTVEQFDTPETIYAAPVNLVVAGTLGTPPMNLIHGTLKQERDAMKFHRDWRRQHRIESPAAGCCISPRTHRQAGRPRDSAGAHRGRANAEGAGQFRHDFSRGRRDHRTSRSRDIAAPSNGRARAFLPQPWRCFAEEAGRRMRFEMILRRCISSILRPDCG
jgi:ABC-type sugar transport system ATPase subunit